MKKNEALDAPSSLGNRKTRAILALLQYGTKERAAEEVGVNVVTLWRWLKEPSFQDALRLARREAFSQSTGRLQQATSAAVTTLLRVMSGADSSASSKVQASRSVIDLAQKSFEVEDVLARLERLEKMIGDRTTPVA
jgi:hypothetical protein